MLRQPFVERLSRHQGLMIWLRSGVDLVLGLIVMAAWAVVAIEVDRSMRAAPAATVESLAELPARIPQADAAPVPGAATIPNDADRQTQI